jgi:hypothetical protein
MHCTTSYLQWIVRRGVSCLQCHPLVSAI